MFKTLLYKKIKENGYSSIVFLCIGTDKILGDSYGPLVGSKLINIFKNNKYTCFNVYGSLEKNINYINVLDEVKKVYLENRKPCIVCIDSALSTKENIGKVFIKNGKTILGKCLNKNKIEIGDISIKGVVGENYKISKDNFKVLKEVDANKVTELADNTVNAILDIFYY